MFQLIKKIKRRYKITAIAVIVLLLAYYTMSVSLLGQFTNYYFYPSESIEKSKEWGIFINEIPSESIMTNNEEVKLLVDSNIVFWFDEFKIKKSYGLFKLFPYTKISDKGRFLRIAFLNNQKSNETIWVSYNEDSRIKSVENTYGVFSKNGSVTTIKLYKGLNKREIGVLKIKS